MQPDYQAFYEFEVGVQNVRYNGEQGKGRCPLGTHTDKKPSFSFNIETGQCTCFSCNYRGNAYLLAKQLNLENPERLVQMSSSEQSKRIAPKKPEIDLFVAKDYHSQISEEVLDKIPKMKAMWVGRNNKGLATFPYFNADGKLTGIKTHKSYWEGDGTCRIYGENMLTTYRKNRLVICEGEPDMLVCPMQSISFSAGAGSIPKDLSPLFDFETIYICYDNDEQGREGAKKVAHAIKTQSRGITVKICQWDENLPKGYDIKDDFAQDDSFNEFDNAIKNAIEYTLPTSGYDVMAASDVMSEYQTPPKSIVQYMLYEQGISLISGTDGVGKTWFVFQMAYCIAQGKPFLDFDVTQKDVLLVQFELSREQLGERLRAMHNTFGDTPNLKVALYNDSDMLFTDQWNKIRDTIDDMGLKNGVVIVDNIYTSTGNDISNNHDLQPILAMIQNIKATTGNSILLVGHHNKSSNDEEPLLSKALIHGGKHLTNFVHNVFQIGESTLGVDLRRGKITKVRDEHCELNGEPFKLTWNREDCLFERGAVIVNEKLHCLVASEKWEITLIKEFHSWNNGEDFDRNRIWMFLEQEKGWMPSTYNINNKLTRYLATMTRWQYIEKLKHGFYRFNHAEITT